MYLQLVLDYLCLPTVLHHQPKYLERRLGGKDETQVDLPSYCYYTNVASGPGSPNSVVSLTASSRRSSTHRADAASALRNCPGLCRFDDGPCLQLRRDADVVEEQSITQESNQKVSNCSSKVVRWARNMSTAPTPPGLRPASEDALL